MSATMAAEAPQTTGREAMHATIDRKALRKLTAQAKRIAGGRVTLPALSGVKIGADGSTVTLQATDLQTAYLGEVDADVDRPGEVLAPARALDTLLGKMAGDTVTVRLDGDRLHLSDGEADLSLRPMALEDFPSLPLELGWREPVAIDAARLRSVLDAASPDDDRPVLHAVWIDAEGGEAVATDSYRLMRGELDGRGSWTALVPAPAVSKALAAKAGDAVMFEHADGFVRMTVGRHRWVAKLQEGTFPQYRALWPDAHEATVTVDGARLAKAADRIGTIALGQPNTPVTFEANGSGVALTAYNQELGEASEKVPALCHGDVPTIAFNPKYLQAMAASVGSQLRIDLRDGLKPAIFVGDRIRGLLMPMRTN